MYVVILWLARLIVGTTILWIGGDVLYFAGNLIATLLVAILANAMVVRMFTSLRLVDLGLWWNRASGDNLAWGLLGGAGAACLVLTPPLLVGVARISNSPQEHPSLAAFALVGVLLALAAMGEELMMRGYGFQILVANAGDWATVVPVGLVFAWLHTGNPNATWLGIANTAGFGVLFGYAFLRSRDLWLPAGLHFGWNLTLPLFGVNVSGLRMNMTGHEMVWNTATVWSGGDYGPEGSVLTSLVMVGLAAYLWKVPVHRQVSPLSDPPVASVALPDEVK
jgi:membrane protease YdiL (CAAX protease family)